jgi:hypothetical protein
MSIRLLLGITFTGLLARAAMVIFFTTSEGLRRFEPSVIAANLNAGRGFTFEQYGAVYQAWREPLHIVLLAWLTRWVGESDLMIVIFQSLFGIGAAVGVALIARYLHDDSIRATVAGIIAAANPFLVYYDTQFIHSLSMNAFLFVAAIGACLVAVGDSSKGLNRTLLAGLVMGLGLLQRSTLLCAGAAVWLMAILFDRSHRRKQLSCGAVWLGVTFLVVSPWLIRNYGLFGRFVLTTDSVHALWLGNNPLSNGTYLDMEGQRVFYLADSAFQKRIHEASEIEQYDIFMGEAQKFMLENPGKYGALVLRRLWAFFWFSPNAGVEYAAWERSLYRAAYTILLSLGMSGLVFYWRRASRKERYKVVVLVASVFALATVYALTVINLRHRVPFELVLSIFAAETVLWGFAFVSDRFRGVSYSQSKVG